ncbi:MAG: hypothetical protein IPJ65_27365 [Archangiaceae bacterium]|nr:hypothetical protein [Archangiaceae bacterium]
MLAALLVLLGLGLIAFVLLTSSSRPRAAAPEPRPDAPALRTYAHVDLAPSGPWQQLSGADQSAAGARFAALLKRLRQRGIELGAATQEDWGLLATAGRYHLCFGSLDDGSGWVASLTSGGDRPVPDEPGARNLLVALDAELRAIPGARTVEWFKREAWLSGKPGEPARGPVAD